MASFKLLNTNPEYSQSTSDVSTSVVAVAVPGVLGGFGFTDVDALKLIGFVSFFPGRRTRSSLARLSDCQLHAQRSSGLECLSPNPGK